MKKIREQLGLSQSAMAKLLNISKSQASMYERGWRSLSGRQLAQLSHMELLLQKDLEIAPTEKIKLKQQKANVVLFKKLKQQAKDAEMECLNIQQKLEKLRASYAKIEKLWAIISHLKTQTAEKTAEMAYLNLLEFSCLEKIDVCGPDQQTLLSYRITLLKQQHKAATKIIEGF